MLPSSSSMLDWTPVISLLAEQDDIPLTGEESKRWKTCWCKLHLHWCPSATSLLTSWGLPCTKKVGQAHRQDTYTWLWVFQGQPWSDLNGQQIVPHTSDHWQLEWLHGAMRSHLVNSKSGLRPVRHWVSVIWRGRWVDMSKEPVLGTASPGNLRAAELGISFLYLICCDQISSWWMKNFPAPDLCFFGELLLWWEEY